MSHDSSRRFAAADIKFEPMASQLDSDRRRLILGLAPAAALVAVGVAGCARDRQAAGQPRYAPTFFSQSEWAFITAAAGRLIPSEGPRPGAVAAGVPEFVDRQMELPYGYGAYFYLKGPFVDDAAPSLGYQLRYTPREIYKLGISAANAATLATHRKEFAALSLADQDRFLATMERKEVHFPTVRHLSSSLNSRPTPRKAISPILCTAEIVIWPRGNGSASPVPAPTSPTGSIRPGADTRMGQCPSAERRPDGLGYERVFPPLAGNPVVEASDPRSVIAIVLEGSLTPRTASGPAQLPCRPSRGGSRIRRSPTL
jgi:hypothetical protein